MKAIMDGEELFLGPASESIEEKAVARGLCKVALHREGLNRTTSGYSQSSKAFFLLTDARHVPTL